MYKILSISHLHITHILSKSRPYHSHWNLGKNWKSWPRPPHLKVAYILNIVLFDFWRWAFPHFWLFLHFCGIFSFECFSTEDIQVKSTKNGLLRKVGEGGITEIKDYTIKNIDFFYIAEIYTQFAIYILLIYD